VDKEIVLILQEKTGWDNIAKYLGKDFFPLDTSEEEIVVDAKDTDETESEGRIYIKLYSGMLVNGVSRVKIAYSEGEMIVAGQAVAIKEIVLTRMSGSYGDFLRQAANLAGKYKCALESRNHEQRANDAIKGVEFGRFHVKEFAGRTVEEALFELAWWHLCGISQAAAEFSLHPGERLPVRRLRVEIRKLRSVLAMLEKIFTPEAAKWREKLRTFTVKLARLRELDVALSNWRGNALRRKKYSKQGDRLSEFLCKERTAELAKTAPAFELTRFTPLLLSFMAWVSGMPLREEREEILLNKAANKRLARWYRRMQSIVRRYPDFSDDGAAHAVRIKAKSMRYVMQSMSGKAYGDDNKVMRSLKRFLDALGILHDNHVNEEIAKSTLKKGGNPELIYQAGVFTGSEREQQMRVRKMLPALWDKFADDWKNWF
jgi:CHAD domain-containing protein